MSFLRNAWYVAAWSDELAAPLFSRTIIGEHVLLYRKLDGSAVALSDICPHRFAPLSMGRRVGDVVQCGYHGLEFGADGQCVKNPQGDEKIPRAAKLKTYPLEEKFGLVWVWMGTPHLANPQEIPDFSHLQAPDRKTIKGVSHVSCGYQLMVDNLMDLGHLQFLHRDSAGGQMDGYERVRHDVRQEGLTVHDIRTYAGVKAPAKWAKLLDDPESPGDFWQDIRWDAPSVMRNQIGVAPEGQARNGGFNHFGTHILTPETEHSCFYFYGSSRNYLVDDPAMDEVWRLWQATALGEEDKPICEAVDRYTPAAEKLGLKPVLLGSDASAVRVLRIMQKLISSEANEKMATQKIISIAQENI